MMLDSTTALMSAADDRATAVAARHIHGPGAASDLDFALWEIEVAIDRSGLVETVAATAPRVGGRTFDYRLLRSELSLSLSARIGDGAPGGLDLDALARGASACAWASMALRASLGRSARRSGSEPALPVHRPRWTFRPH